MKKLFLTIIICLFASNVWAGPPTPISGGDVSTTDINTPTKLATVTSSGSYYSTAFAAGVIDEAAFKLAVNLEAGVDYQGYDADLTTYAGITPSANVQTFLGYADFAAMKTGLGYYTSGDSPTFTNTTSDSILLTNAGVIKPSASTDGNTVIIQAYGTDGSNNPELKNVITCTNDTAATANNLPECSIANVDLSLPILTGDIRTSGTSTGLTNVILLSSTTTGLTEDAGTSNQGLVFTDSGETFTTDVYIGMTIYNVTDSSSCTVTDNNGTTITCDGLTGGTDNEFDDADAIVLGPGPKQSNSMFFVSVATTLWLPNTAGYTTGIYVAGSVVVKADSDPLNSAMTLNFHDDGVLTDPTAGVSVDGDGTAGDQIIFMNASTTESYSTGVTGSWATGS